MSDADAIIIGGGLAGLVAANELVEAGRTVIIVDQEGPQNLGGQAFWSLGGLFFIDSPEQRRLGIRDSFELAHADWMRTARFDRNEDGWPRQWAEAYLQFAAGEKRAWLREKGFRFFPIVGWAERRAHPQEGAGNSIPRFHITWGAGPGVSEPFADLARAASQTGKLRFAYRHKVTNLLIEGGRVQGVAGDIFMPDAAERGAATNRTVKGTFTLRAETVLIASGGIGGNHDLVRKHWPARLGTPPQTMVSGVPEHVDGHMLEVAEDANIRLINQDRMWHYVEGIRNWDPIWPMHGIRILPGPSSLWLDATGKRLCDPNWPGFDTMRALAELQRLGHGYSWFILNQSIIKKEFALSGSEQNPDLTGKSWKLVAARAFGRKATGPVEAFKAHGADFVVADTLGALVDGMNRIGDVPLTLDTLQRVITARDAEAENSAAQDAQLSAVRQARQYIGDRLIRTAKPHRLLDPKHGPLIAVRLNILTRKSLGGIETDLSGRALGHDGQPLPGLFAAGEAAGFGGGGVHGYGSLEGTFLGGCIFSGRSAGRAMAGKD